VYTGDLKHDDRVLNFDVYGEPRLYLQGLVMVSTHVDLGNAVRCFVQNIANVFLAYSNKQLVIALAVSFEAFAVFTIKPKLLQFSRALPERHT
jgi:cell division protein FtsW (lipid II flippase)